jgi:hypothetical protein
MVKDGKGGTTLSRIEQVRVDRDKEVLLHCTCAKIQIVH